MLFMTHYLSIRPGFTRTLGLFTLLMASGIGHAHAALQLKRIASGLSMPVAITHAGDGSGRIFITLQEGKVLIHNGSRLLSRPFLDISSLVSCCDEQGLLSVAFHPRYKTNGRFYVNYTDINGDTVVARYTVSPDPNVTNPDSRKTILSIAQPFPNHNGGQLQFGPRDGYLYIGMGDGGDAGDPGNRAQDKRRLLGKMLRIDVNRTMGNQRYAIPADNPFVGNCRARPEIWALGLRNPWRFSFDRKTGDLFIGDVGQDDWEEVDFQSVKSKGGENYGWRRMEGKHCFNPPAGCQAGRLKLPIIEYGHDQGCSITGGYRYRGKKIPKLLGTYLHGDYCSGRIWGATYKRGTGWKSAELRDTGYQISAFGEDETGEVYVVNYNGAVYRIVGLTP